MANMDQLFLGLGAVMPAMVLALGAIILLLGDLFKFRLPFASGLDRTAWCLIVCASAWAMSFPQIPLGQYAQTQPDATAAFLSGRVYADAFSFALNTVILFGAGLVFLLGSVYFADNSAGEEGSNVGGSLIKSSVRLQESRGELAVLTLLATCGGLIMVQAGDLFTMFLGLELLSICVYVLAASAKEEKASTEAGLKYFVMGAFSSAFFLYGIALIYGSAGTLQLVDLGWSDRGMSPMLWLGMALVIFGFGFKLAVAPFHFWAPDVYQGSPTTVTVFMALVVKIAAAGAMLRVMTASFGEYVGIWHGLIWAMSAASMIIGNLAAIRQTSIKRMLAYSSVAHGGYLLLGLLALGEAEGGQALLYYCFIYSLMTVASFGVVLLAAYGTSYEYERDDLKIFEGLGYRHPALGLFMTIALFSLAGMPPFAGFMGKFYLFRATVNAGYLGLVVIAALASVVSLFYYLRVVRLMYFCEGSSGGKDFVILEDEQDFISLQWRARLAIGLASGMLVILGIAPGVLFSLAEMAVHSLSY